ncbi:MAG: hypothetical protein A3K83_03245 [Omnitrophica WOR_2 bacterium RBG_13_44_8b]|nr:MAG: hypothetical protein A3K83_03245 [Omnitrophica WOR_2 bacterium RBG_13_44_8b]
MKSKSAVVMVFSALVLAFYLFFPNSVFSQCIYPEEVLREYPKINRDNNINEKEAGIIAQYEFIQRDVKNYFLKILNEIKSKDKDTWLVTFQAYADGPEKGQALDVCVDKKMGEITCWEKRPLVIKEGKVNETRFFYE